MNARSIACLVTLPLITACTGKKDSGGDAEEALILATDLPMQGWAADMSQEAVDAVRLVLEQHDNAAGAFAIELQPYDDSTAEAGLWDPDQCAANATAHVQNDGEVAIMGTLNSGCAAIELPTLNQGDLLMVSHANTFPALTVPFGEEDPATYSPSGKRTYGRVIAHDLDQALAAAQYAAAQGLTTCVVLNDGDDYWKGLAAGFAGEATSLGITILGDGDTWDSSAESYVEQLQGYVASAPDCIYLAGFFDDNGAQLVADKTTVLGDNDVVQLFVADGFLGYTDFYEMPEASGTILTYAGSSLDALVADNPVGQQFVDDFTTSTGAAPTFNYTLYAAAATQLMLAAIADSDGTRASVVDSAFGVQVSQGESVLGQAIGLDENGDALHRNVAIVTITDGVALDVETWAIE